MRALPIYLLTLFGAASPRPGNDAPQLPPPEVVLRIDAPDPAGPWRMVVFNKGEVPVRLAADGRLLSLEMPKSEDPYRRSTKKKGKPEAPVVCKLPPELRPSGVVESRAVILAPGARYEEVVSPALYCFGDAAAKALVAGTTVTARLGFDAPAAKPRKGAPPPPPFVVEPAVVNPTVSAQKELVSEPFVLAAPAAAAARPSDTVPASDDPGAPRLELAGPARVDTVNELTVAMTLSLKNVGGRPVSLDMRRDNLVFEIDGPDGSTRCGQPVEFRRVPPDAFAPLLPGATRTLDVWVGEMCPDVVFDRPGLYRVWPSLAFPKSSEPSTMRIWTETVTIGQPILVRVREGRLPFYPSGPQVLGASH